MRRCARPANGHAAAAPAAMRKRPPSHSITSSAAASRAGGNFDPGAPLAVFKLTTVMNFVARSIGMSPGLAPLENLIDGKTGGVADSA